MAYKIPESVLVVVYTRQLEVLLLQRAYQFSEMVYMPVQTAATDGASTALKRWGPTIGFWCWPRSV